LSCSNAKSYAAAFESFLKEFKTSPEHTLTTALGNITIDEDELSDDYDFMDEDEQTRDRRQEERAKRKTPQYKYNDMLQLLADRKVDEFAIDLDDLATVSWNRE
jgi:DNA replication licensing factor MCM7